MRPAPPRTDQQLESLPADWWLRLGHDLRGPIAPMRMAVQLLQSGRLAAADQADALELMDRQIDLLLASIDDLTDLLRLNAGVLDLCLAPNDLNIALDAVSGRSSLGKVLEDRQQSLRCVHSREPVIARHDPARVAALLEYLIRKSAEHAAPGAVLTLELKQVRDRALLRISGAENSLASDADLAHVAGLAPSAVADREAKPVLMREIARLNDIAFLPIDAETGICLSLQALPS